MPGVKITRRDIKRDELAEGLGGLAEALRRHARSVGIAALAVAALGLAVGGGIWFSRMRAAESRGKLAAVYKALGTPTTEEGTAGSPYATRRQKYDEVVRLAGIVISDHPSSDSALWATYYKAVGQKEVGDLDGALATLRSLASTGSDEFLLSSARFLEAQVLEAKGDLPGALELYAGLVGSASALFPVEMAMMSQARVLEAQGKIEEAKEVYRRITQEYPDSPFTRDASQRLSTSG